MRPIADKRAGFKSLDDLRLCILAFVSLREAAEVGLPLKPLKSAAPGKERWPCRGLALQSVPPRGRP